jgi:hypothetical protein
MVLKHGFKKKEELKEEFKDELNDELKEQMKKQLKKSVHKPIKKVMDKKKKEPLEPLPSEDSTPRATRIECLAGTLIRVRL